MINGSTLPVTSANFLSSSVIAKVPVRSLLSLKQKRVIAASATISSSAVQSSVCALDSEISIKERKRVEKSESFFNLFRDYGFEDSQIQKLSEYPRLGQLSARILKPKLDCLVENGFTGELLHKLIVSAPYILGGSLDGRIKPNLQILKQYLDSNERVVRAINRNKRILTRDLKVCLIPNIEFLINEGVPVDRVLHLLLLQPGVFMQSREGIANAVKTVGEFGVAMDDTIFIFCIRVVCELSESSLKKKLEFFKSLGWSDEQVSDAFKKCPTFLSYSVERIRARYEVLKILKSQKLIRGLSGVSAAVMSEDRFFNLYVIRHEYSVPGLLDMYNALLTKEKTISTKP